MLAEEKVKRRYWKEYFWILSFLKPYKKYFALLILGSLFIVAGEIIIPKAFQIIIDDLIPGEDVNGLLKLIGAVIVVVLLVVGAYGLNNLLLRIIREKAARDLQYASFNKLRDLGFSYVEKNSTGEILSLLNTDVQDVQEIYRNHFPNILLYSIIIVTVGTVMLTMHVWLTLLIIPCYLLYYLCGPWVEKQAFIHLKKYNEDRVALEKHVYETMSSMQEIRAYGALDWRMSNFRKLFDQYNRRWLKSIFYAHLRGSIRRVILYFSILLLFWIGAGQVSNGALTVGEFVAFNFYFMFLMMNITHLVTRLTEQQTLMIQAARLYNFYHQEADVAEMESSRPLPDEQGEIEFRNVTFSYQEHFKTLDDVSFQIQPGEHVAFVGETGSGKSTAIKLLGRFYDPREGEILINRLPIQQVTLESLREKIGYVFQECYLFGASVKENIRFGNPDATDHEVVEAARKAYAHEFIEKLPQGYETEVGERGYKLSGGQKQRVAIARMFLKDPSIVVLDEATSSLDNESEAYVQKALLLLGENRTIITVAHRLSTIHDADRIFVMRNGQVVESGSYDELIKTKGYFYELVYSKESSQYESI